MTGVLLTLNAGSSSLKFAIFDFNTATDKAEVNGKIAGIGSSPRFSARASDGTSLDPGGLGQLDPSLGHDELIARLLPWLTRVCGDRPLRAVGHRVVHGGRMFGDPTPVTPEVLKKLETLAPLAPLHQPHNLAAIHAVAKLWPGLPQIACFDTGFHRTQERLAELFALPRNLSDKGILRYGFHGLSYDYIARVLPDHLGDRASGRVIVAHLGNGSSLCAMYERRSVATSMGFTTLDGLMMGRRSGTLDPGVVLHLLREERMTAAEVEDLLYRRSGLLGVSGISNDMQVLERSEDPHAQEAVELYCYRAASVLAGLVPAIGGLDALVFTAGIGENSVRVRRKICDRLKWLGVSLDNSANEEQAIRISSENSPVDVLRLPTNEEAVVASACRASLS